MKKTTLWFSAAAAAVLLAVSSSSKAQVVAYDNITTFEGSIGFNGGVTAATGTRNTILVADDIAFPSVAIGQTITNFVFSIGNANSTSQAIKPQVRFYAADGANGGPGTFLSGLNFSALTVAANNVSTFNYSPTAAQSFVVPANGLIWAGITFQNNGTSQTAAVINNFGQGLFNPPAVGSSMDEAFYSTSTGTFAASSPAGSIVTTPYSSAGLVANFGWQFSYTPTVVPEPSTYAYLLSGALLLGVVIRRRRMV